MSRPTACILHFNALTKKPFQHVLSTLNFFFAKKAITVIQLFIIQADAKEFSY